MVNTLLVLYLLRIGSTSSAACKRDAIQGGAETSAAITHFMVPGRERGRCRWLRCSKSSGLSFCSKTVIHPLYRNTALQLQPWQMCFRCELTRGEGEDEGEGPDAGHASLFERPSQTSIPLFSVGSLPIRENRAMHVLVV